MTKMLKNTVLTEGNAIFGNKDKSKTVNRQESKDKNNFESDQYEIDVSDSKSSGEY